MKKIFCALINDYSYTSRFLNKSKSSAVVQPDDEKDEDSDSRYGSGRSRYMALKERRTRLARSRSSHSFGNDDDEDEPTSPISPTTASPSAYLASRCEQMIIILLTILFYLLFHSS